MGELLEVGFGKQLKLVHARRRERDANHALTPRVGVASDESLRDGAVDQTDSGVVAQDEVVRDLADGRPGGVRVPPDRE
jgi:hypothetical protein